MADRAKDKCVLTVVQDTVGVLAAQLALSFRIT